MNFIMEFGFDVREGKSQEFQQWLSGNEEKLAAEAPEGNEYVGTYAAIFSNDRKGGSFRQYWRLDSYAAQDKFSEAMKSGGTFARLMEEATAFVDQRNDANWTQVLCRRVTDAAIWGE